MPWMLRGWSPAVVAGAVLLPGSALGQRPVQLFVEAGASAARVRSDAGGTVEPLDGAAVAVAGGVSIRAVLLLEARYAEANLTSENAAVEQRDLAEGELLVGVRPHPLLTLKAGPHARAYRSASGTRRWVFWEARVRGTAPIIPSRLAASAELWAAVAGSTSLSNSFTSERGGEVGAQLEIPGAPLAVRVGYRIDRGRGDNPARTDTAEQVLFTVRFTLR